MTMTYGSVCSGIEAATVAWKGLGWKPSWFSEIEPFPSAVLAHHYPDVPNTGDMLALPRKILAGEVHAPDILCGGTPCQGFSVAGLRGSLDDDRSNLSLTFCEIANAIDQIRHLRGEQPSIIFWENVPGVLNTKDNAFGCLLGELAGETCELQPPGGASKWANAGCVFGPQRTVAWRVFDAQYFGVAQRRRRVFVVASARTGFDPTEILFELDGLRRDTAPSRKTGQEVAATTGSGTEGRRGSALSFETYAGTQNDAMRDAAKEISPTLRAGSNGGAVNVVAATISGFRMTAFGEYADDETASTMKARDYKDATDLVAFNSRQDPVSGDVFGSLDACSPQAQAIATKENRVRRLTPRECERLQGFPEVTKMCMLTFYNNTIFDICFIDQLNINALADQRYHKSPNNALIAEEKELKLPAKYVVQSLNVSQAELEKPALVNVRIDLERNLLLIHNQEKSLLSVKIADKKKWCPLPIRVEDFARLSVATLIALEREVQTGREESQASTKSFTHQKSGKNFASLCGLETGDHAKDVQKFTRKVTDCMKYITSEVGQSSQNSEQILQTLLYCVTTAINSFIQGKIHPKSSYVLSIEVTSGYTQIPWAGKPADQCPDGHRYKALGNSWAVPVVRWIGSRIDAAVNLHTSGNNSKMSPTYVEGL